MTRRIVALLLAGACGLPAAEKLIGGIAHVGLKVADLEKTRAFYTEQLGFRQAYELKDASGKVTMIAIQVSPDEFLEFSSGAPVGFTHLAFLSDKLEALHRLVETLGLTPPDLRTGHDRTRNFSIQDPDHHRIEFVEYEADSMQAEAGKGFVGRGAGRIHHIGLPVADNGAATAFFKGKLGFQEVMAGWVRPAGETFSSIEFLPASERVSLAFLAGKERAGSSFDPDGMRIELIGGGKR